MSHGIPSSEGQSNIETLIARIESAGPVMANRSGQVYESGIPSYAVELRLLDGSEFFVAGMSRPEYYSLLQSYGLEIVRPGIKEEIQAGSKIIGKYAVVLFQPSKGFVKVIPAPELDSVQSPFLPGSAVRKNYS
ncbi:hypothetical protein D6764_00415 [Candidatus Woesearchaeota archaeon]|nr:MAG: hypothetical protein D6764_00415 [Candidatus Woesearchaeota archaeon]